MRITAVADRLSHSPTRPLCRNAAGSHGGAAKSFVVEGR
jgi:hypothetical protein